MEREKGDWLACVVVVWWYAIVFYIAYPLLWWYRLYPVRRGKMERKKRWVPGIYSLAQTATLTSLAIFLSSSLTPIVTAAPTYNLGVLSESNINIMEMWEQPCGTPLAASLKRSPQRHSVHRALKRVRIQLRVAQNHFRKDLKVVHELYSKVYKVLRGQYHQSWLPKNQLEWYYNEVWCKEKSKKAEYALPKLHDALQRFAITFHLLKRFRLNSNINVEYTMNKRNDIMAGMQNEVHRVSYLFENNLLTLLCLILWKNF
ncbi:hypothetical protein G9C98_001604 [Cotesia typhae]|uniref:Uncharacterized protein n=1 Tax=Cotesia typhae TaxID=2053667 RepID=A0A8J5R1T0_9HYME|nr:hypothetical protein G9C98_001604 [Cotesia typhae]